MITFWACISQDPRWRVPGRPRVPQDLQPEHGQDQLQLHAQPQAENWWSQQINIAENNRTTNFESMQLPKTGWLPYDRELPKIIRCLPSNSDNGRQQASPNECRAHRDPVQSKICQSQIFFQRPQQETQHRARQACLVFKGGKVEIQDHLEDFKTNLSLLPCLKPLQFVSVGEVLHHLQTGTGDLEQT